MNDIILVGNPNVGKTTLFNTLTKSHEKASNWHGVTVDIKNNNFKFNDKTFVVSDLPGLYSLNPRSSEEKIACDYLKKHKDNLIVNICDANNLKRNLKLTKELAQNSYKVILAVNMINEVKNIDLEKLSSDLGLKIVGIDARKNKSVDELKNAIYNYFFENNRKKMQNINKIGDKIKYYDKIIEKINNSATQNLTNKIDSILLNRFIFFPVFLLSLFLIFYITFGPLGDFVLNLCNKFFLKIFNQLSSFINNLTIAKIVKDFLIYGVLNSALTVTSFLPQIILLMMCINILEDIGFMSRVAFMFDGILKKIGLTGKSLFSIMMGYGCTTTAVLTTRNLDNNSLRKRTALILPFSLCSAKLPIFLTISSLFFKKYKFLFVFLLYIISVVLILLFSIIYKKLIPEKNDYNIFEMPKYRLPYLKKIIKDSLGIAIEFLYRVGTIIIFSSSIFWILQNFSFKFGYLAGENFEKSILYQFSNYIKIIFKPIGLNQAGIVSSLILGLVAKELIIVGFALINGVNGSMALLSSSLLNPSSNCFFTVTTSIIFLLFTLIYSPCISALSMIKNEFGFKTSIFVFVAQFLASYAICFVVYRCMININFLYVILIVVALAIVISFMLKLKKKKYCKGNCNACRKIL